MLRQDYYYDNVVIWVFAAFLISYYTRMRIIMTFINIKDGDMWHANYFLLILCFFFYNTRMDERKKPWIQSTNKFG